MIGEAPICLGCKHFRERDDNLTCDVFPQGIPLDILTNQADHRRPYPGDQGILFDPVDDAAAERAAELFDEDA